MEIIAFISDDLFTSTYLFSLCMAPGEIVLYCSRNLSSSDSSRGLETVDAWDCVVGGQIYYCQSYHVLLNHYTW